MPVIGRFAPSPTGPLHFGSLVAATASYLAARQAGGKWLLRIEDLDQPREQPGAADSIIHTLASYGFEWDGDILFQSQRLDAYHAALAALHEHTYPCTCSRKEIQAQGRIGEYGLIYPGTCRHSRSHSAASQHSIRLRTDDEPVCFTDRIQGQYCQHLVSEVGDFVVLRADGLFAYQLAVVVDDGFQGVNQIVRGADLLDNTPRQLYLQRLLGLPQPDYAHVPLVLNESGQKLSKQNLAPAIRTSDCLRTLVACLRFLRQDCPDAADFSSLAQCWEWALAHWDITKIGKAQVQAT